MINKHGVCIRVLGNLSLLPLDIQHSIAEAVNYSKHNTRLVFLKENYLAENVHVHANFENGLALEVMMCNVNNEHFSGIVFSLNF